MSDIRTLIEVLRREVGASPEGLYSVEVACLELENINRGDKRLPKWLRPFSRNQYRINVLLIRSLRRLLSLHRRTEAAQRRQIEALSLRVDALQARLESQP